MNGVVPKFLNEDELTLQSAKIELVKQTTQKTRWEEGLKGCGKRRRDITDHHNERESCFSLDGMATRMRMLDENDNLGHSRSPFSQPVDSK